MSQKQKLRKIISNSPRQEFWVDEHALNKLERHTDLDIYEITNRLRSNNFKKVEPNDSAQGPLKNRDSFKVVIEKSTNYLYTVVIYDTIGKPLIKTVYELDSGAQSNVG